jgi:hypothetical protein
MAERMCDSDVLPRLGTEDAPEEEYEQFEVAEGEPV